MWFYSPVIKCKYQYLKKQNNNWYTEKVLEYLGDCSAHNARLYRDKIINMHGWSWL